MSISSNNYDFFETNYKKLGQIADLKDAKGYDFWVENGIIQFNKSNKVNERHACEFIELVDKIFVDFRQKYTDVIFFKDSKYNKARKIIDLCTYLWEHIHDIALLERTVRCWEIYLDVPFRTDLGGKEGVLKTNLIIKCNKSDYEKKKLNIEDQAQVCELIENLNISLQNYQEEKKLPLRNLCVYFRSHIKDITLLKNIERCDHIFSYVPTLAFLSQKVFDAHFEKLSDIQFLFQNTGVKKNLLYGASSYLENRIQSIINRELWFLIHERSPKEKIENTIKQIKSIYIGDPGPLLNLEFQYTPEVTELIAQHLTPYLNSLKLQTYIYNDSSRWEKENYNFKECLSTVEKIFENTCLEPQFTELQLYPESETISNNPRIVAVYKIFIVNFLLKDSVEMERQAQENETDEENPQLEDSEQSKILKAVAAKESSKGWFNNIRKMKTE